MNINIKLLDHLIAIAKVNKAINLKNQSVRRQDFESASKYREDEKEALKGLLSVEELIELRNQLTAPNDQPPLEG